MLNVPNLCISCIIVKFKISFENSTDYSSESSLSVYISLETSNCISKHSIMNRFFFFLHKIIDSLFIFNGVNILLEEPHENYLDFLIDHFIDTLNSFPKFPILKSVFHELEEIFEFYFLFSLYYTLNDVHEFRLFELVLLFIKNFLNMFILVQKIVITKLTAGNFISNWLLQHEKSFLQNFGKCKIFIKSFLTLYHIHYSQNNFALLFA